MCELCSTDKKERERAISNHMSIGDSLFGLANDYRRLAYGTIKPHTGEAKMIALRAKNLIRILVADWL